MDLFRVYSLEEMYKVMLVILEIAIQLLKYLELSLVLATVIIVLVYNKTKHKDEFYSRQIWERSTRKKLSKTEIITRGIDTIPIWFISAIISCAFYLMSVQTNSDNKVLISVLLSIIIPLFIGNKNRVVSIASCGLGVLCIFLQEEVGINIDEIVKKAILCFVIFIWIAILLIFQYYRFIERGVKGSRNDLFYAFPTEKLYHYSDSQIIHELEKYLHEYFEMKVRIDNLEYVFLEDCELDKWASSGRKKIKKIFLMVIGFLFIYYLVFKDRKVIFLLLLNIFLCIVMSTRLSDCKIINLLIIRFVYSSWAFYTSGENENIFGEVQLVGVSKYHKKIYSLLNIASDIRCMAKKDEIQGTKLLNQAAKTISVVDTSDKIEFGDYLPTLVLMVYQFLTNESINPKIEVLCRECFERYSKETEFFIQSFWCYIERKYPNEGGGAFYLKVKEKILGNGSVEKTQQLSDLEDAFDKGWLKILFLPNWKVKKCDEIPMNIQPPDYNVSGQDYWFFRYFKDKPKVDILDVSSFAFIEKIEKNKLRFYIIQAIKAIILLNKYDLVISHGMQSGIVVALWRRLFITRAKHIVFDIGSFNSAAERGVALKLMQFASKSIDGIIYHTSSQKNYYNRFFPWIVGKSEFIKFGTDYEFFNSALKEHNSVTSKESEKEYCICVGYSKRDWNTLVKAFQLADTGRLMLKLVGHVDEKYSGLANIEQIGFVSINELMGLIKCAKFSILPLKAFNYSYGQMTLMQQMAMEKCVITSEVPSLVDYVEDRKTALLYEPENCEQLAEIIEIVNSDEVLRHRIAENARNYIKNINNEKVMAEEIEKFMSKYKGKT